MLRGLLDQTSEGLLAVDEHGSILAANTAAARFLGHERRRLVGKPLPALVELADRRALRAAFHHPEPGGASLEVRLLGNPEPWTLTLRTLPRVSPRTFAVSFRRDGPPPATATPPPHPRALERLVLRFPHAAVAVGEDGRVAFANGRARRLLGADAVRNGVQFGERLPETVRMLARRLVAVPAPLQPTLVELEDTRVLRVSGLAAAGDEPAVLLIEDATEQRRHDRVMREFLRNAAHQLRTPLTAIMAAVETLQSGAKDRPADRDRFLEHIQTHASRLTRIARGLLVLARAQTSEQLRVDVVEVEPLLEELRRSADPRPNVSMHVACEPGLAALAAPDLLHEALAALVDNAVAQTFDGEIVLEAREEGADLELRVADSGPGILPEFRDRVFEPFFRAADDGEGFGLGLAIAAQSVSAMGGAIDVAERPGGGTALTITLRSAKVAR